ncbi:28S ribosomal protein S28, mitochondrial-like [Paramacrobiotus metropolitanus]|uniref:28S ribosomal protein S28, mitochondrial-like n=1 Tax=Paramacrobiotus metropolitanus TaxID=2943436 RepID=UPI0024456CBF|nr:28S ribosomal protein S28, mitochondrial-like [Paramacrobiotus metropolitanus]
MMWVSRTIFGSILWRTAQSEPTGIFAYKCLHSNSGEGEGFSDKSGGINDERSTAQLEQSSLGNEELPEQSEPPVRSRPRRGFAAAFERFRNIHELQPPPFPEREESFASMLRHSKYIQLGDPEGKIVVGRIYHVVADDLYIDFGGKFPCVCKRPQRDEHLYYRSAFVRVRLNSLELSTRFLGADRDLTLLEADAALIGPMKIPPRRTAVAAE